MLYHKKLSLLSVVLAILTAFALQSCGGKKYLVIPHSVSSAATATISDLRLQPGDYEVLQTVSETASVICEYRKKEIKITSGDGEFSYLFKLDPKTACWSLKSFSGAANMGYFTNDYSSHLSEIPNPEEFARRVAMSRIINMARDYSADAVIEPICVSRTSQAGKNKIEYSTTVTAKLIQIKVK